MVRTDKKFSLLFFVTAFSMGVANFVCASDTQDNATYLRAAKEQWPLLEHYCADCHNTEDWAGGIAFETMFPEEVPKEAETWEKVVSRLRGGLMPPPGEERPGERDTKAFVDWLERYIDHAASQNPRPGKQIARRLNRKEYANAVRDLLDLEVDASALLPLDTPIEGFDNVAEGLTVSPAYIDQSLTAARIIVTQAVGNPSPRKGSKQYFVKDVARQQTHVEGLPLGTRGGKAVEHYFPADGEYELNIGNLAQALWVANEEFKNTLIATIDGKLFYEQDIGGGEDLRAIDQIGDPAVDAINTRLKGIRFYTTAGPHKIAVTFKHRTFAEFEGVLEPVKPGGGQTNIIRLRSFEIRGPIEATGLSDTPARHNIFTCYPKAQSQERQCAEQIIYAMARKAYRGQETEADIQDLMKVYELGRNQQRSFELGIRRALTAILASPNFLYQIEAIPQDLTPGTQYRINDLQLASRLSFFLWSSIPDDKLLNLAEQGELSKPDVLQRQVARMLADPKSETLVSNFAYQWLNMGKLDEIDPDPAIFADVSNNIRTLFKEETRLFVDSILRKDRNITELLTAKHTFVNEDLALHYGIKNVKGDRFRRVELQDSARWGLLGKGSTLMSAAYPNRTSPVLRGAYVLEHLMGTPPTPPPPNVEALKENVEGEKALTVRERLIAHRKNPTCNGCHGVLDPLGFALENFDAVGRWREIDRFARTPIDSSGVLPDGTELQGPDDLRNALMRNPEQFVQTFTEKLMLYALGRRIEYEDMPTVRTIVHAAEKQDYHFSAIVMGIIGSSQFQMRQVPDPEASELATTN